MTLLQTRRPTRGSRTDARTSGQGSDAAVRLRLATRRPLVPTAVVGGVVAAAGPLLVWMALALVGWYLTDAGAHGSPSGALRVGALGWLVAHGSGIGVEGVRLTAIPLGLTLVSAWTVWRLGQRVGESISDHGPDSDRIADGERDWTVPIAATVFGAAYLVVGVLTATLASSVETAPSAGRVAGFAALLTLVVGVPAIARGSGRAAIWVPMLPPAVREAARVCRAVLVTWLAIATLTWVVALATDFSTAANVVSQLGADSGDTALISVLSLGVLPNATLFSSAYLLGPGFSVGTGTIVSPGAVVLGPLPMFPLLAALPSSNPTPGWTAGLVGSSVLVALLAAAWIERRLPAVSWDRAAVRGCAGSIAAGAALGVLTALAGGAVGPGRLQDVGPHTSEAFLAAVTGFGIGGVLGALAMWWWTDRGADRLAGLVDRVRRR